MTKEECWPALLMIEQRRIPEVNEGLNSQFDQMVHAYTEGFIVQYGEKID